MIVTLSGRSGLRNAYVSVLSAEGSSEINGASRWLDASAAAGLPPRDASAANSAPKAAAARTRTASFRIVLPAPFRRPVGVCGGRHVCADSPHAPDRFDPNQNAS